MKSNHANKCIAFAAGLLVACLSFLTAAGGQGSTSSPINNPVTQMDGRQANNEVTEAYLRQNLGDPKEEAAYQAFHKTKEQDANKKIRLGNAFLAKYPSDRYSEAVYEELTQTYYDNKDLTNFYAYSDKGLSLFPDDVHLLALRGWVIPRAFTADEPDADQKLDKAEADERHALDVISKMEKPPSLTDQQFDQFKTGESAVAHSGLGLVYFRREHYAESAKELQNAIQSEANPDPTDLLILGADFENLGRFKEAADAFNRCAQMAGGMQDRCKQYASSAGKQAAQAK
jgi:tetratricopeptide (TPR) repeat protein